MPIIKSTNVVTKKNREKYVLSEPLISVDGLDT